MKPENSREEVRKTRRQFPTNKKKDAEKQNNETPNQSKKYQSEAKQESDFNDPLVKIPGKETKWNFNLQAI
jgi:hypothetical protein